MDIMNQLVQKRWVKAIVLSLVLWSVTGCNMSNRNLQVMPKAPTVQNGVKMQQVENTVLPVESQNGVDYVSASQLFNILQFQTNRDDQASTYEVGDSDVKYTFTINSRDASRYGTPFQLANAPIQIDGNAYLPISSLYDLFQEEMSFEVANRQVIIHGSAKNASLRNAPGGTISQLSVSDDQGLPFAEDPNDPAKVKQERSQTSDLPTLSMYADDQSKPTAAQQSASMKTLVEKAKQYLGVEYLFGAKPYAISGKFDCSSYTQYIYGKFGISLPRTATPQSKVGTPVSRQNLRIGDLLFFNVPGVSKTSTSIGHVGIYMGNMQMIHSNMLPKNGVQITNIDTPYYRRVFIKAVRVGS